MWHSEQRTVSDKQQASLPDRYTPPEVLQDYHHRASVRQDRSHTVRKYLAVMGHTCAYSAGDFLPIVRRARVEHLATRPVKHKCSISVG